MAKFGVGDTVVGNALNCHGVTCEDCVLTVTYVGSTTFSGMIDSHPEDNDYKGEIREDLRYEWFDLEESVSDIVNSAQTVHTEPPKMFQDNTQVAIVRGPHKNNEIIWYIGQSCRVINYIEFENNKWSLIVLLDNGAFFSVWEHELVQCISSVQPEERSKGRPTDVKTWGRTREVIEVQPAHREIKAPIKITPSLSMDRFDSVFDSKRTKRRGHVTLRIDK